MSPELEDPGVAMPLSRITVGSLKDMGYSVNYTAADSFTIRSFITPFCPGPPFFVSLTSLLLRRCEQIFWP